MPLHEETRAEQATLLENATPALERLQPLMAAADATQISALHSASPSLELLGRVLAADQARQGEGLQKLEADEKLEELEKLSEDQRSEFDALDFIGRLSLGTGRGLWGSEEFHSGVLAWLLDPWESHGLGDRFLRHFLLRAGVPPAGLPSDWSATLVTREWSNEVDEQRGFLDILVVNEAQRILCAIENKVFSREHSEQLTRYRRALEEEDSYSTFTKHYLFLTPQGTHPSSEKERKHWTPVTYLMVFDVVQQIVKNSDNATTDGVGSFLRQYATALRRNIMPETSVSQLARSIYLEHREAIHLIAANEPDWMAEAKQWLREAISRQEEWKLDYEDSLWVRFRSTEWDKFDVMHTGTQWAPHSDALLLFQFQFEKEHFRLYLGLSNSGEASSRFREKLFERLRQHPQLFRPGGITDQWATLHVDADYVLDDSDYGVGWDDDTTREKLEQWIQGFAANRFPAMNEIIVNCLREYEAEGQTQ